MQDQCLAGGWLLCLGVSFVLQIFHPLHWSSNLQNFFTLNFFVCKCRCEADLKKIFSLKERVDAVEQQTVEKLAEERRRSDKLLAVCMLLCCTVLSGVWVQRKLPVSQKTLSALPRREDYVIGRRKKRRVRGSESRKYVGAPVPSFMPLPLFLPPPPHHPTPLLISRRHNWTRVPQFESHVWGHLGVHGEPPSTPSPRPWGP